MNTIEIEEMKALLETTSVKDVAKKFGVSPSLVRYYAVGGKNGKYRKKLAKESDYPGRTAILDLFTSNDFDKVVAKAFGVTVPLAKKWIMRAYDEVSDTVENGTGLTKEDLAIRKLTPRECWSLMDFNAGAYDAASKVNSSSQLYKQAGNAIVKNCLVAIIGQMFSDHESDYKNVKPPVYTYSDETPYRREVEPIQYSLDDGKYRIEKNTALIEMFGGVGTQAMAFETLGVPFTYHLLVEFDKFPVASYNAIHGTSFPTMDIRDVHIEDLRIEDKENNHYFLTYSFPCTDLSNAGKMAGMSRKDWEEGNSTRSGLLWEVERILREGYEKGCDEGNPTKYLPDTLLMENVTQVHSAKNKEDWDYWLAFLESIGYKSTYKDMNSKDYGVPQNRNRTFCVSYLERDKEYIFPEPIELETCMEDYLEDEEMVDEKYYINTPAADKLLTDLCEKYGNNLEKELFG